MARYIEIKEAVRVVDMCFYIQGMSDDLKSTICNSIENNSHAIEDVAPVIHAHWHIEPDPFFDGYRHTCSACGWVKHCGLEIFEMFDYCPHCGAKMDEEV